MSGAQSHHIDGMAATSTRASRSGSSSWRERAAELDDAARVQRLEAARANRLGDLAVDLDADVGVALWAASTSSCGPLCG